MVFRTADVDDSDAINRLYEYDTGAIKMQPEYFQRGSRTFEKCQEDRPHDTKLSIIAMTNEIAKAISLWKYEGAYSFYDHNENNVSGYMDGAHFACMDASGSLVGYCCFGVEARIPAIEENVYDEGYTDIGLGLKPDSCGKGNGLAFLNNGLVYAKNHYGTTQFRLSVATFNERAITVYKRAGFYIEREVTNSYFQNKFYIMKYICRNIT